MFLLERSRQILRRHATALLFEFLSARFDWRLLVSALVFALLSCDSSSSTKKTPQPSDPLDARQYAYAFELKNVADEPVSLRDFRGELILLNFWATWCAPCVAEMPALKQLHDRFKDKGFSVVSVSTDPARDNDKVRDFIKTHDLSFPVLRDPQMLSIPKYAINGFPESFFVSPTGTLIRVFDPKTKLSLIRISKERDWSSQPYIDLVQELLEKHSPRSSEPEIDHTQ